MTKTIIIHQIEREDDKGNTEHLDFEKGVNVITGPSNSGKTMWLQMLDYAFGDPDTPDNSFGDLAKKYSKIRVRLSIGGKEFLIERRWKEYGMRSKVLVNDEPIPVSDFSSLFLTYLDIPLLHYPKGDPYSERTWPELSWRTLYRHVYRREHFWTDIADQQPIPDQHAAMAQFLGLASNFFPPEYGEMVNKRKQLFFLKAKKEQFTETLDQITNSLMNVIDGKVFATPEYINQKITELDVSINKLNEKREQIMERSSNTSADTDLIEDRMMLLQEYNRLKQQKNDLSDKRNKISELAKKVQLEEDKLLRGKRAGLLLKDIKITHCPACNQEVDFHEHEGVCSLCNRAVDRIINNNSGTERFDFEIKQLRSERQEANEIVQTLDSDLNTYEIYERRLLIRLKQIDEQIKPLKTRLGAAYGSELASIDMEMGRRSERVFFYNGLSSSIQQKNKITQAIDELNTEISQLEESLAHDKSEIKMEEASEAMENGMASYLTALASDRNKWSEDRVYFDITNKSFNFIINGKKWSKKLGARMRCHFLLAYNYGLLTLSSQNKFNYPGITIIDLPPELRESYVIGDQNYIVAPFQELCNLNNNTQLIITGHSFDSIEGVHKIVLTRGQYSSIE